MGFLVGVGLCTKRLAFLLFWGFFATVESVKSCGCSVVSQKFVELVEAY